MNKKRKNLTKPVLESKQKVYIYNSNFKLVSQIYLSNSAYSQLLKKCLNSRLNDLLLRNLTLFDTKT